MRCVCGTGTYKLFIAYLLEVYTMPGRHSDRYRARQTERDDGPDKQEEVMQQKSAQGVPVKQL